VFAVNRCWADSIIPYNAQENRLPKRTGRAEVTVLHVDFRAGFSPAFSAEPTSSARFVLLRREL
jgi:hypothetical protein